jgi:hypothetical protein
MAVECAHGIGASMHGKIASDLGGNGYKAKAE